MAGDAENKRGYRTIFRSISQVFYANAKNSSNTNSSSNNNNNNIISYNNNTIENNNEGIGRLTVTLTSITPPTATWTSTSPTISTCTTASASAGSSTASSSPLASRSARSAENISCSECGNPDPYHGHESAKGQARTPEVPANADLRPAVPAVPVPAASADQNQKLRASSMLDLTSNHRHQNALRIVPVTDILRAQQIQEDNEVQQTQQTTILQRYKSVSIGNLLDLPGEDDKKSIKNRMRMKSFSQHPKVSTTSCSIDDFPSGEFSANRLEEGAPLSAKMELLLELRFQVEATNANGKPISCALKQMRFEKYL